KPSTKPSAPQASVVSSHAPSFREPCQRASRTTFSTANRRSVPNGRIAVLSDHAIPTRRNHMDAASSGWLARSEALRHKHRADRVTRLTSRPHEPAPDSHLWDGTCTENVARLGWQPCWQQHKYGTPSTPRAT